MTELEDKIRNALHDPRWDLAAWSDPMPRIRREAARQRKRTAVLAVALVAIAATPLALLPAVIGHGSLPTRPKHHTGPLWAKRLPGEIAYECGNYLCLERPNATARRVLPRARFPQAEPAWSPNGRRLAFDGYYGIAKGDGAIFVADANGCHARELASTRGGTSPAWSPTASQIAFALGGIDVINADGTGLRSLTSSGARFRTVDTEPAWSATNQIAFTRFLPRDPNGEIYVMHADGSGVTAITHGGRDYEQPAWSPNGRLIAFTATYGQPGTVIEVARANGSGMHRLSPPQWMSYDPVWTPDGQVAFLVDRAAGTSIYIVNADGAGLRELPGTWTNMQSLIQFAWGSAPLGPAPGPSGCA